MLAASTPTDLLASVADEKVAQFQRDGYLILKGAIGRHAVETFENTLLEQGRAARRDLQLDDWRPGLASRPEELEAIFADADQRTKISSAVYQRMLKLDSAQAMLASLDPQNLARQLLHNAGGDFYLRRESTVVRVDLPGPSPIRLDWHQEVRYDPTRSDAIQFWLPFFRRSSWEAGSMEIAVGSHKEGILEVPLANPGGAGAQQYAIAPSVVEGYEICCVAIEPGDVAVLHSRTIHKSSDPERQTKVKITVVGRCLRAS